MSGRFDTAAKKAPLIGCVSGGCLLPLFLFAFAAISGDMGGPLIWPFAVMFLGAIGGAIGAIYGLIRWSLGRRRSKTGQLQSVQKSSEVDVSTPNNAPD